LVLTSSYKQHRAEVADALRDLITGCRLKVPSEPVTLDALGRFKSLPVDFPDTWIAAIAAPQVSQSPRLTETSTGTRT
jgi:hypothetical protein